MATNTTPPQDPPTPPEAPKENKAAATARKPRPRYSEKEQTEPKERYSNA